MSAQRIVLVGAGHAHHHALAHLGDYARHGCAVTLVSEGAFWYSGMATGVLGGRYAREDAQIDVGRLAQRGGAAWVPGRVEAIDPRNRLLTLADGVRIGYDLLSLSAGSRMAQAMPGADPERVFPVKPLSRLWELRCALERQVALTGTRPLRLAVIGGGASACEVAANAQALISARGGQPMVTLITGGPWLEHLPTRARRQVAGDFSRRGVSVIHGRAVRCAAETIEIADGAGVPYDLVADATGLRPAPPLAGSGLPSDPAGALLVDAQLRSLGDPRIHGGGDCIAIAGHPLPRLGVFAVRQGPILHANLLAAATGGKPRTYHPQRRWLSILNLGVDDGMATWGPFSWHGRSAWRLKDRIDRAFIRRYRV